MHRPDYRSPEAAAYRKLYQSARWKRLREAYLRGHPLCIMCQAEGRVTAANVVDHQTPHKGDLAIFWGGPFQAMCKPHHDGAKQSEDRTGYSKAIGLDGFPSDPRHPANRTG